jgi:hypothetical protein
MCSLQGEVRGVVDSPGLGALGLSLAPSCEWKGKGFFYFLLLLLNYDLFMVLDDRGI